MTRLLDLALRPTKAIVNLAALAANVRAFRRIVSQHVSLMAVVKANGYGHGAVMVAQTALTSGVSQLAVATIAEGRQLRRAGVTAPILVLGPVNAAEVPLALRDDLAVTVGGPEMVDLISEAARNGGSTGPASVHLKIDTGMRRFGCLPEEAPWIARRIAGDARLRLDGVFTHFACADESDDLSTIEQAERFDLARRAVVAEVEPDIPVFHAANSAATLRSRRFDYNMVRLGIAMYGVAPSRSVPLPGGMQPVMSVVSEVGRIIPLSPGDRVSYGGTYTARRHEHAALVPIGYADGYRRSLSNRGWMGVQGVRAPVRGRVCMDQTVIGLPHAGLVKLGDEVTVVGSPSSGAPAWSDLAEMTGTIAYELLTGVSARVPRIYVTNGQPVAVECLDGLTTITDAD